MSFFKKPSWAQARKPTTQPEFYRRSTQMHSDIIAIESDESSSNSETDKKSTVVYKDSDVKKGKRRRISQDDNDKEKSSPEAKSQPKEAPIEPAQPSSESDVCDIKPDRRETGGTPVTPSRRERGAKHSPRTTRTHSKSPIKQSSSPKTIRIDSASPPAQSPSSSKLSTLEESENDGDNESDQEIAEIARQARARAQNRSQQPAQHRSTPNATSPSKNTYKSPSSSRHRSLSTTNENGNKPTQAADDPVMSILITSELENTTPLIVHRKLGQNLGEVRKTWCQRQKFSEETTASVFLTWRGRRVFDVTTCRSLGIGDVEESLFSSTQGFFAMEGVSGILMVAVTAEAYEEQKRRTAVTLSREEESAGEEIEEVKKPEPTLQLILKSPDMADFQVKVRPTTELSRVVSHFRKMRKLGPEKTVILLFDGDRLDMNSLVEDAELDDMDCIDVLIK